MNRPRAFVAAASGSDGRIYAIGGFHDFFSVILATVEAYDLVTDTWVDVSPMATRRMGLAAAVGPDGTIYALGGNNHSRTFLESVEKYNASTDTWSTVAPMPTGRRDLAAAASVQFGIGKIFAIGGHGSEPQLTTVEVYTP
jgi:N-acetylneuraminic acid mutarotase